MTQQMRIFIRRLLQFAALPLLLVIFLSWPLYLGPLDQDFAAYQIIPHKRAALAQLQGPKIVLIGGSNVRFGLSAAELHKSLQNQRPVYNFGTYGGFGLDLVLQPPLSALQAGDIAVISLEEHLYYSDSAGIQRQTAQAIVGNPPNLRFIDWNHAALNQMVDAVTRFVLNQNLGLWNHWTGVKLIKKIPKTEDINSLSPLGDLEVDLKPSKKMQRFKLTKITVDAKRKVAPSLLNAIAQLEARGVRVVLEFPPLCTSTPAETKEQHRLLEASILRSSPSTTIVPSFLITKSRAHFYNTSYHLNEQGRRTRSRRLAKSLDKLLADTSVSAN